MPRRPVQPHLPEVERLVIGVAAEKQSEIVGGVGFQFRRLFLINKGDCGVLVAEDRRELLRHRAVKLAAVRLLEPLDVAEPSDGIAQRPDRELHQDFFSGKIEVMAENHFSTLIDFQPEADEIFLHAFDRATGLHVHAVKQAAGVEIAEHATVVFALRELDTQAPVEVEADAVDRLYDGVVGRRGEYRLGRLARYGIAFYGEVVHDTPYKYWM